MTHDGLTLAPNHVAAVGLCVLSPVVFKSEERGQYGLLFLQLSLLEVDLG